MHHGKGAFVPLRAQGRNGRAPAIRDRIGAEKRLGGHSKDDPIGNPASTPDQVRGQAFSGPAPAQWRTSQTMSTPTKTETRPTMRIPPSGTSSAAVMARLAASGNTANRMPSITKTRPSAARKSDMRDRGAARRFF